MVNMVEKQPVNPVFVAQTRGQSAVRLQLESIHSQSHCGIKKLVDTALEQKIKCAGLNKIAKEVVESCRFCSFEFKLLAKDVIGHTETPKREMQEIHIDHLHLSDTPSGNRYCLTMVCPFSKFFIAIPTRDLTMYAVKLCLQTFALCFGNLETCRSDRAFLSYEISDMCDTLNVKLSFFASHNSRSNTVERQHRTYRELSASFLRAHQLESCEWDKVNHLVVRAMQSTTQHTHHISPYKLVFNKAPEFEGVPTKVDRKLFQQRQDVYNSLEQAKAKYVTGQAIPRLEPGTRITVKYHAKAPPFDGIVLSDDGGICVEIKRLGQRQKNQHAKLRVSKRHVWLRRSEKGALLYFLSLV